MEKNLNVIEINENHSKHVRALMRQGFGLFGHLMAFDVGKKTFAVEDEGVLLGVIVCGEIKKSHSIAYGMVKYIVTDHRAQGLGVASMLVDEAMTWFEAQGHAQIIACVEGYNTASSQLFEKRGFQIRSFPWQLKHYGLRLPWVWLQGNHGLDLGHFWWVKEQTKTNDVSSSTSLKASLAHLFISALIPWVIVLRQNIPWTSSWIWLGPLMSLSLFGIRFLPMMIYAKIKKYPLSYRGFDNGQVLAFFISGVLGGVFLSYGGVYPNKPFWREDEERTPLAQMHGWALLSTMLFTVILIVIRHFGLLSPFWQPYLLVMIFITIFMQFFDTMFAFFPMSSYAGARVRAGYPKFWWVFAGVSWLLLVLGLSVI